MTTKTTVSFASDNYAGIHPEAMEAIARANRGHAPAYGDDAWTHALESRFCELLGDVKVFPVFNGTGANVTALAALVRPHQAVICAETAHVQVDECGAPERFVGCKLIDLPTNDGKLTPELVEGAVVGIGDEHHVQAGAVTISQSSELGTVYTTAEVRSLADAAHRHGLLLHMDGARISNAAASLDVELREITGEAGIDVLSFGGTKNGLMAGEAVVFFDSDAAAEYRYVRKQAMQLNSKMRFSSAQLLAMVEDDLWRRNAGHANAMARRLADGVAGLEQVEVVYPVQANAVFARLPRDVAGELQNLHFFYVVDEVRCIARWMCSWDTAAADVDAFVEAVRAAAG